MTTPGTLTPCPLCGASGSPYREDRRRQYLQCSRCRLVFVLPEAFVSASAERAVYELHENDPDDPGYRRFLSRLCDPLAARLAPGACGLDVGSGPGPTLSVMFEELGHPMRLYDPYFAPDRTVLSGTYDFVTATEVVEHFREPAADYASMWACVRPGGYLGLMTKLVIDRDAFSRWHYKDDETHLCFHSRETLEWLGGQWAAPPVFLGKDVVIFEKNGD
jgi:hypothetical protein